jgi:hypothetical protein
MQPYGSDSKPERPATPFAPPGILTFLVLLYNLSSKYVLTKPEVRLALL